MAKISSGFRGERGIVLPISIIDEFRNDELGKLLYITDIGFYPKAGFHFRKRTEIEALQYILMYCIDGEGWIEVAGNKQKLATGEVVILPKGNPHSYGSNPKNPWSIYWIHFDGNMASYFCEGLEKPILISTGKDSRIEDRLELFEDIFSILKNGYSKINLDYSVTVLFHFLGSLKFINAFRNSLSDRQESRDVIEEAIHFMRENIQRQIKLEEIAKYTGFSTSHFSILFKQKTGYSPLNYFNQLRIQNACHQLDFTNLQVNQIAMMIGFEDQFYFSRIFCKIMGCSPTEYRKRKKG
ncbi:MAG TPA: AraC family transcriptional regulator [Paludibacter sp.]|nr:AraC family transcriptional regulator [Paludibacter sp.]